MKGDRVDMIEIKPIGRMAGRQSASEDKPSPAEKPCANALVTTSTPYRARPASSETVYTNARPAAAFLTQFIDQHGNFPRDTTRRIRRLDKATSAYHQADNLAERQRYARAPRQGDIEL